ncbi:MAG: glycosyltransferase family 4 protein [bacterium]|nr:glycosyltransferase family 4 protein [bacterium]
MADKKLNIIITGDNGESLPPPYGGIIKRCLLHAKEWKEKGAEVYLHVYHRHEKENDLGAGANYFYDFKKEPSKIDKIFFAANNFLRNPFLFFRLLLLQIKLNPNFIIGRFLYCAGRGILLDKKIKQIDPDILITETGCLQSAVAVFIGKKNNLPVVLENYAEIQYLLDISGNNQAERCARLWDYLVNQADAVVSASKHCSQGPKKYVRDESRIKIIYSGINFNIFNAQAGKDKAAARKEFGLPHDKFLVMAVGALKMRKGHDQLLEALLIMPDDVLNKINVVICGMGSVGDLIKKAGEIGFPHKSLKIFQGLSEESLAQLYSSADCFCFPSITPRECMGMAMKEAMAVGLPIVAYNAGGIKEAIEQGINGFLAPVGDQESLALAIKKMMDLGLSGRSFLSQSNIIKARHFFDIKKTAEQLYQVLLKLVLK